MGRRYLAGEVAKLSGVSVRTLHHYDRIGLLRPAGRSEAGYRRYDEADLLRLQQVLTLRALGFGLDRIGELLARPGVDLEGSLRAQRLAIRHRVRDLEAIDAALGALLVTFRTTGAWDWPTVVQTAAAATSRLTEGVSEMEQYYTPEQMEQFRQVGEQTELEEIAAVEQGWTAVFAEVRAARANGLDPASTEARAIVERWDAMHERTARAYRDHPELWQAIGANYDRGAFEGHDKMPQAEDYAFVERIKAARG